MRLQRNAESSAPTLRPDSCGAEALLEPIWVKGETGRIQLGVVKLCCMTHAGSFDVCERVLGEPKRYVGGSKLTSEAWALMLKYHKRPPYYYVQGENGIIPETAPQQRILPVFTAAEVKAANANMPDAPEFGEYDGDEVPF